jgi:hypothetical protein
MNGVVPVCLLGAVLALASPLGAQASEGSSTISARPSAEALYQEGVRLSERGQLEEACQKFEASEALDVAVGTLLRLADCRERTGRYASAWSRFREAGSLAAAQGMKERARIAAVRSAALERKMARLVVEVPPAPPDGYTVKLGDVTIPSASFGTPLPLDPGTVQVEASAPGHAPYRRYVAIPRGEGARVQVSIPPLESRSDGAARPLLVRESPLAPSSPSPPWSPPRRARARDPGHAPRVVGLTLAATGGVGLATGGVLALLANDRRGEARERCPEGPRDCSARAVELEDEAARARTWAAISSAVGGGLALAGLVVYLTAPSSRRPENLALSIAPDARGGVTLRARGAF